MPFKRKNDIQKNIRQQKEKKNVEGEKECRRRRIKYIKYMTFKNEKMKK